MVSETKVPIRRPPVVGVGVHCFISFFSNQNINREKKQKKTKEERTPKLETKWAFTDNTIIIQQIHRPTGCRRATPKFTRNNPKNM